MKLETLSDIPAARNYLTRIGAEARSLTSAVIKEQMGAYWKDLAVIRFTKQGDVTCSDQQYIPTDLEASAIKSEFMAIQWPEIKPLETIVNPPKMIKEADKKDVFEFRNQHGKIVMIQVRIEREGDKNYVPWTYWSDDIWRACEVDGPLPLYNAEKLKDASTAYIHEGAKAARHCQWMVEGKTQEARDALKTHPWGEELSGAVHLGWVGGALSPYRTDWSAIQRMGIKRAYIVADNDEPGRSAVPAIAQQLRMPTFTIQFTDEFPPSFDLADEFPESLFGKIEG